MCWCFSDVRRDCVDLLMCVGEDGMIGDLVLFVCWRTWRRRCVVLMHDGCVVLSFVRRDVLMC